MLELTTKISSYWKYVQELKEEDGHAERIDEDLRREMATIKKEPNGSSRSEKYDSQIKISVHGFNGRMGVRK